MTSEESEPLVNALRQHDTDSKLPWTKFKISLVLILSGLNYFGIYYYMYPRNEWLQNKVERETFPNVSVSVDKVCGEVNRSDPDYGNHARVQEITAKWNMYITLGSKCVSLFTTFIYTAYTDCFGRRFLFILGSFSMFITYGLVALIIYFDAHPIYVVATEILYGLTGTSYGFLAATYMFIADSTLPGAQRSTVMFLAAASNTFGEALGAFTVGFYIEYSGYFFPALTSASLQLVLLIIVFLVIPESLSEEKRISPPPFLSVIKRPFSFYTSRDFKHVRCGFLVLSIAFAFADMTVTHRITMETLYQLGLPFCWKPTQIAIFATAVSLGKNVAGLGLMKMLQKCATDVTIAFLSAVTNAGSLVVEGLATNSLSMYLSTIPTVLNNLTTPLIRSTLSAMTSETQQGALFASVIMIQSLCSLIGAVTDNSIYAATLEVFNGFVFIFLAGYCAITFVLLGIFICMSRGKQITYYQIQKE